MSDMTQDMKNQLKRLMDQVSDEETKHLIARAYLAGVMDGGNLLSMARNELARFVEKL